MNQHVARVHSQASNAYFSCEICEHVCCTKLGLDRHIMKGDKKNDGRKTNNISFEFPNTYVPSKY